MLSETISLYIDLQEGQKADLEAVARASLAFADAIREIAGFIDPFSDTRIELISTTEGSISLNTKIKFRAAGRTYEITLYALLLVFASYITVHVGEFVFEKATTVVWEQLFGEQEAALSDEDKEDIVSRAVKAIEAKAGERQIQRLYAELNEDPAVIGVGVSKEPGVCPSNIVPRNESAKRSGITRLEEPAEKK